MNGVLILLCLSIYFVQDGCGLLCYYCHQTSKKCNSGALDRVHQKNCSEDRCAVMKYETPMPGRKVLATIRDCAAYTEHELTYMVSSNLKNPVKVIFFQECDTPLCNGGLQKSTFNFYLLITAIIFLIVLSM